MPISLSQLKLDESSYSFAGSYIMALDCGTGSVRASIVDEYGCIVAESRRKLKSYYPHDGWVEQDPTEMLASQIAVMTEVQFKTGIHSDRISAIGISNQRETIVVWDRDSGQPIYNAIGWQCHRTVSEVEKLRETGVADTVRAKTGLILDPYFSASKIAWILDNVDGARTAADAGELMCGTVDTWLVYNLTGGEVLRPTTPMQAAPCFSISIRSHGITNFSTCFRFRRTCFPRCAGAPMILDTCQARS